MWLEVLATMPSVWNLRCLRIGSTFPYVVKFQFNSTSEKNPSIQRTIPADLTSVVRMSHTAVPCPRAHSPRCLPVPGIVAGRVQHHCGRDLTVDPGRPLTRSSCWSARSGSFPRGLEPRAGKALSKVRAVFLSHPVSKRNKHRGAKP